MKAVFPARIEWQTVEHLKGNRHERRAAAAKKRKAEPVATAMLKIDPLRVWRTSTSPAELLRLCGGPDGPMRERLERWVDECNALCNKREINPAFADWYPNGRIEHWIQPEWAIKLVRRAEVASLLRCIVPAPRTCPACEGRKHNGYDKPWNRQKFRECFDCRGTGLIHTPPAIDPRWLSATVLDLARGIAGGFTCTNCKNWKFHYIPEACIRCKNTGWNIHQPDLDPIRFAALHDRLMDEGCDDEAILSHLLEPVHCGECWVIDLLSKGIRQ